MWTPDGVSNLQTAEGVSGPSIAMFTPDGVNQIGQVETQVSRAQVLAYLNGGNYSPDGVNNVQAGSVGINGFTDVVIRYSENSNAAYVG